jgi:hypothetical protein
MSEPRIIAIDLDPLLNEALGHEAQAAHYEREAARLRGMAAGIRQAIDAVVAQLRAPAELPPLAPAELANAEEA